MKNELIEKNDSKAEGTKSIKKLTIQNGNYILNELIEIQGNNGALKCNYKQCKNMLFNNPTEEKKDTELLEEDIENILALIRKIDFNEKASEDDYLEGGSAGKLIIEYDDSTTMTKEFGSYMPKDIETLYEVLIKVLNKEEQLELDFEWVLMELIIFYVLAISKVNDEITFANCYDTLKNEIELSEKDYTLFNSFPTQHPVNQLYNAFKGMDKITYQKIIESIMIKIKNYDKLYGDTRLKTLSSEEEVHNFAYEICYLDKSAIDIHNKPKDKAGVMNNCISKFIEKFKPGENLQKPDEEILNFGRQMLPKEIVELWKQYGFGEYANGLIKVVDPRDYMNSLYTWLGHKDYNKIPIIVTAFGDIFYYRRLENGENDISLLNIHYGKIEVCGFSYQEFFERYILHESIIKNVLRVDLYKQAVEKLGKLDYKDIFFFVPALILGGGEDIEYVKKGNGAVHHQLLFGFFQ